MLPYCCYVDDMSIGARLRQLRQRHHLSGEKLGELCGVSRSMVSQWESDMTTPPTDRLLQLRKHIGFSFDWLLYGEEEKVYSTSDPKLGAIMQVLEPCAEYVKDAAVSAVITTCTLADRAKSNNH